MWIAVGDVVLSVLRRDANAGALRAHHRDDRVDHLEQEPHAIFDAAAVSVGALVGAVAQELIDEIAVSAMHLDAVEARGHRVLRPLRILRYDARDLGDVERAGRGDRLEAFCRIGLPVRPNGGGRHRQRATRLEGLVRDAADMPELEDDAAAGDMDRARRASPPLNLLGAVDAGRRDIALTLGSHLRRFRDDEACARALRIIERVQLGRDVTGCGAAPCQRGHGDAVWQGKRSERDGREEV